MAKTYTKAPDDVRGMCVGLMQRNHPKLAEYEHGRPKLRLRKHDHQFGWFDAIAKRHGETSQECQQAQRFYSHAQLYLPFETAV